MTRMTVYPLAFTGVIFILAASAVTLNKSRWTLEPPIR